MVFNVAEEAKIKHTFNTEKQQAGTKWLKNFIKRTGGLSIRRPEATSLNRINGFSEPKVMNYFKNLETILSEHKNSPSRIFNIDETGITTVHRPERILAPKGQKQVGKATSGERGRTTTAICCVSATGLFHPPMFVFARKDSHLFLVMAQPHGSIIGISNNGWSNEVFFLKYLKSLVAHLHPTFQNKLPSEEDILKPSLIVMDNHESHCSLEVIDLCRIYNIHIVTLPPHTSHRTQPLDVTFFGPFKKKFY